MPSTFDRKLALDILTQISEAIQKVKKRFAPINSAEQFTNSDEGMEKLLSNYPEIEWQKVMGMRDIISHHYFDVDAEAIFDVCANHIDKLANTIKKIINAELR